MKIIQNKLETELKQFFINTKTKKVIIGISGGIDSAVTLAIAMHALGKENIFALLLPYKLGEISSYKNFEDAEEICKKFDVEYKKIELDNFVKPYCEIQSLNIKNSDNLLILGNTLARIRMTLLFAHANKLNGIVLGTCNLTEVLLGYETKFGDGAADVSVIGNLWKREVYELGKLYNLPESFITKKPSAELYENQSDEEEMGFSYDDAEIVLKNIIDKNNKISKNINSIDKKIIENIYNMYKNSEHKRKFMHTLLTKK
ncbi:TPA: NAD+ synthase [Candidatus Gracilibacteria bacterium]|nr:NAD+ synthase [Candidatus Peregrinibacteria bacterium]HIQ56715.1 NAD+ synthase [Candidatus Gracilibacteria bacterium]HIQ57788.1 NAD+ synthase [Candidatus Gracilibacteria bacterium]